MSDRFTELAAVGFPLRQSLGMAVQGHASWSDILLLLIYPEFGVMVGIYLWSGT